MIIVHLKGGLGNQMFQYALGRKLAHKNNDELKLDTSGLHQAKTGGDIYRPFSLERFNIKKNIATEAEAHQLHYPYGILSKVWQWFELHVLRRTNVLWDPKILHKKGDLYLNGYWQSPKYFEDIREVLLKDFTPTQVQNEYTTEIINQMESCTSVSIHVRRGDYVQNPRVLREFGICSSNYYTKAVARVLQENKDATFFIFSDDIAWVKNNLNLQGDVVYISGKDLTDTTELYMMSRCTHNIIANSSFSWWAAWLNQNPTKLVLAPTPWFETAIYDKNLIPDTWIQIPKT